MARPCNHRPRAARRRGAKLKEFEQTVARINEIEPEMELLDDAELRTEADGLRERGGNGEPLDDLLPEAFALPARRASARSASATTTSS